MKKINIDGFIRISKATARRIFENGGEVYICPSNLRPGGAWHPAAPICAEYGDFTSLTNSATFYSCNACAGRHLAYYIKENPQ